MCYLMWNYEGIPYRTRNVLGRSVYGSRTMLYQEHIEPAKPAREHVTPYTHNINGEIQTWRTLTIYSSYQIWSETHKFNRPRAQAFDMHSDRSMACLPFGLQQACWSGFMYVVTLVSRLPMQIVEETVSYGWPQVHLHIW